jgi:ADP-ribose pyrophosphatase
MSAGKRVISSSEMFRGKIFSVVKDEIELEDGRVITRDVVRSSRVGAIVPLIGSDVLLVKQYRHAIGDDTIEIPAGLVNRGELPRVAAAREMAEEIGYRIVDENDVAHLTTVHPSPGGSNELMHIYCTTGPLQMCERNLDADEIVDLVRMPYLEALRMAQEGKFIDAKTVLGLVLAEPIYNHMHGIVWMRPEG